MGRAGVEDQEPRPALVRSMNRFNQAALTAIDDLRRGVRTGPHRSGSAGSGSVLAAAEAITPWTNRVGRGKPIDTKLCRNAIERDHAVRENAIFRLSREMARLIASVLSGESNRAYTARFLPA